MLSLFMRVLFSRDSEVGVYYTQVRWALTFPNLRRHYVAYNIQCTLYVTIFSRFVPIAKEFLRTILCFLNDSIHSTSTSGPILLMAHTLVCRSTCCVCFYTRAFSTAVLQTGPLTLSAVL